MKEQFIPYEQTLKLKELGFNEKCIAFYTQNAYGSTKDQKVQYWHSPMDGNNDFVFVLALLWQQAFDWFRYNHRLEGLILPQEYANVDETGPRYFIGVLRYTIDNVEELFNSTHENSLLHCGPYQEARLACLDKLIEIVEQLKE